MFEIIFNSKKVRFNDKDKKAVADQVLTNWRVWDSNREEQKNQYSKLMPHMELKYQPKYNDKDDQWKSDIHINKIFSIKNARTSFIWKNIYSNISQMYNLTHEQQAAANTYKVLLDKDLELSGLQQLLGRAVHYLDAVGEACFFTGWKSVYEKKLAADPATGAMAPADVKVKDVFAPSVIHPLNIVWELYKNPDIKDEWDRCGKIVKSWATFDEIKNNKLYRLSNAELDEIKAVINDKGRNTAGDKETELSRLQKRTDGKYAEVLTYFGDFLYNGETYENAYIVVIAGKALAAFMENPFFINPIINCALARGGETYRGISKLYYIIDSVAEQEEQLNLLKDAQSLSFNPPAYVPSMLFKDKIVKLRPGKLIEYDDAMVDTNKIRHIDAPAINTDILIQFNENISEETANMYPNLVGEEVNSATEASIKNSGKLTQIAHTIAVLKQDLIIPIVKNLIKLKSFNEIGQVYNFENVQIDDALRNADFEFTFENFEEKQEKQAQYLQMVELFKQAAQIPEVAPDIKWRELLTKGLELIGIPQQEEYFKDEVERAAFTLWQQQQQQISEQQAAEQLRQSQQSVTNIAALENQVRNNLSRRAMTEQLQNEMEQGVPNVQQ